MMRVLKQESYRSVLTFCIIFFLFPALSIGQTWHEVIKLTASDAETDDRFGFSVSISGDRAIIGTYDGGDAGLYSGSAYIFELVDGTWIEIAKLTASDAETYDHFGISVSISGDRAVIGAPGDGAGGSIYIFELVDGIWMEVDKLIASDTEGFRAFGRSVSISVDQVIVGDFWDSDDGPYSGSAYIFESVEGLWTEVEKLTASDADEDDRFGWSVSISGNRAIVGAFRNDHAGSNSGSAYIFELVDGTWTEVEKLTASDAAVNDSFGSSVCISGDHVIVGAYGNDDDGEYSGSAYIFELTDEVWLEVAKLTASDGAEDDFFGSAVSISGDLAIIGAYGYNDAGWTRGSAYIFKLEDGIWMEIEKLIASDGFTTNDKFGTSVAVSGDCAIIGATRNDDDGTDSGSAYIFEVCPFLPTVTASADDSDVCIGDEVTLTGGGAETYIWDGDVTDGEAFEPEIGTTTYTVTGIDDIGCGNIASIDVTVNPLPEVIATAADSAVCLGDEVLLIGGGAADYVWSGGVTDSEAFEPEIGTTTYTVTGTDDEGCQNTASVEITVFEALSVSYSTTDEIFGDDGSINISVIGGNPAYSFDWDNDGSGDFDDDEDLIDIPAGTYVVEVLDEAGCTKMDTMIVDSQLGIGTFSNQDVSVYPNPAENIVVIESEGAFICSLMTLNGKTLFTTNAVNKAIVDISEFADGIYVVQINAGNTVNSMKLIKR